MKTCAIILLAAIEVVSAQMSFVKPGTWRSFTDMRNVQALASAGTDVWAATTGGLFRWDDQQATFDRLANSDGLTSNNLTAVFIDPVGRIWVGTADGSINVLEPSTNRLVVINDIKNSNRVQKRIRTFSMSGDSLFVGTDFGVSVFRLSRWEFGDTYANLGFSSPTSVNKVIVKPDSLWIATNQGMAAAPRFLTNLSSPSNWIQFQTAQGLPANDVTSAIVFRDTLIVGTVSGAAFFTGTGFQSIASLAGSRIIALTQGQGEWHALVQSTGYEIKSLAGANAAAVGVASDPLDVPTDLMYDGNTSTWYVGTTSRGIDQWGPVQKAIIPNGPLGDLFSSLAVDPNGVLWCATGISGQGNGFSRYNPLLPESAQWKNFTVAGFPVLASNDYYKVAIGANNRIWVSSWGVGVAEVADDTVRRRLHAGSIPALASSVPSGPPYVVVGSVSTAPDGTDWFVNRTASTGNFLARLVSDSAFSYVTNAITPGQGLFTAMVIDKNGSKWLANAEPFNKPATGLYYFNESGEISGTSGTGGWGLFGISDGLPNNTVLSLAVDREGNVCVGTDLGFMMITDPLFPKQRHFTSFPLREQSIQAIAVDALNNKWVGTKEGVFVMNQDATQLQHQYTVASTGGRLVDDDIRAIAIDQERGMVYIGTEKGLSSLSIEAVMPLRSSVALQIGPNPFFVPSEGQLVIRNLVAESSIKILSVDGSLITEFRAQGGGRAFWDGKDQTGSTVGTGVYFVVAFAQNGEQIGTGKVAVVKR